ncbi:MAG TPA: hypothetical protein VGQ36_14600 [Thermoanaerobaculia bacterium]|jgi:hypothetical protein|nr:hypothetical protein [Thermoanaerobaculia bacterium]
MLNQAEPIIQAFRANIPADFIPDVFSTIFEQYEAAYDTCDSIMDATERHDVLATMRRGMIETAVRNVARRYPTAEVLALMNQRRTSHFSLIKFGPVDLTFSKSGSPKLLPRPAMHRTNLFEHAQASLFDNERAKPGDRLYGILIHGPARRKKRDQEDAPLANPKFPSFARIVFPDQEGKILASIDLFRDYRLVVHKYIPPVEPVEIAKPKPLRIKKKKEDEE